jgi:hypothetical protein
LTICHASSISITSYMVTSVIITSIIRTVVRGGSAMYQHTNEDVAFERLKDLQREMENSRRAVHSLRGAATLVRHLSARAWWLAGLAMRRPPRRRPGLNAIDYEDTAASDVA